MGKHFQPNKKYSKGYRFGKGDRNKNNAESVDERREFVGVHEGSFPIEEVKASPLYLSRIVYPENTPKRKYALCFGYLGTPYQGLQINPGAYSIESVLERALFLCGGISENNYGNLGKIAWTRSARYP